MPAYIPPHRRQGASFNAPQENQQGSSAVAGSASRWQGARPSSRGQQNALSSGSLLQAHGDSFIGPLTLLPNKPVDVRRYSGATAKGLHNEQSSKQVGRRLIACLDKTRPEKVLLQFGNVDINISSVYKLETKGEANWNEKQFVADVWNSYQAFLKDHILSRLIMWPQSPSSTSHSLEKSGYIQSLYLCKATLPIVGDEALPESHAKYQYTASKKMHPQLSPEEDKELEIQSALRVQRVEPLIPLCGLEARRRMTTDFNTRLKAWILDVRKNCEAPAKIHLVDLNQSIRKGPGSDEVGTQHITDDPTNLHIIWETTLPFWIQELASAGLNTSHLPTQRELDQQLAKYAAKKGDRIATLSQKRKILENSVPDLISE